MLFKFIVKYGLCIINWSTQYNKTHYNNVENYIVYKIIILEVVTENICEYLLPHF